MEEDRLEDSVEDLGAAGGAPGGRPGQGRCRWGPWGQAGAGSVPAEA